MENNNESTETGMGQEGDAPAGQNHEEGNSNLDSGLGSNADNDHVATGNIDVKPEGGTSVERPEWLQEQFWDKRAGRADIRKLSKSYDDLRAAFNKKNDDIKPDHLDNYVNDEFYDENGNMKFENSSYQLNKEDEGLQAAYKVAYDMGLGVRETNQFINRFLVEIESSGLIPEPFDAKKEMEKLGHNGKFLVDGVGQWVEGLGSKSEIDESQKKALLMLGSTADGILALDYFRKKLQGEQIPARGDETIGEEKMTKEEWYNATYEKDKLDGENQTDFKKRMHAIAKQLFGDESKPFDGAGYQVGKHAV